MIKEKGFAIYLKRWRKFLFTDEFGNGVSQDCRPVVATISILASTMQANEDRIYFIGLMIMSWYCLVESLDAAIYHRVVGSQHGWFRFLKFWNGVV